MFGSFIKTQKDFIVLYNLSFLFTIHNLFNDFVKLCSPILYEWSDKFTSYKGKGGAYLPLSIVLT